MNISSQTVFFPSGMTEDWDGRIRRNVSVGFFGIISTGGTIVEIGVCGVGRAT